MLKLKNIGKIIGICFMFCFILGCGVNKAEYNRVVEENQRLKAELDEVQNGADRLFVKMQNLYSEKKFDELKQIYTLFQEKHLDSELYNDVKKIYDEVIKLEKEEEERILAENEKKRQSKLASLKKLKKEVDDISGVTWYKQSYFVHYTNTNLISIYLGQRDKSVTPRLIMSYTGDDWIFFENAYLSYEGNTLEIKFDKYRNKETENKGGQVWEWIDVAINSTELDFLRKFAESGDAKMRLSGKYSKTRNLSVNERQGIIDVINGYDLLTEQSVE